MSPLISLVNSSSFVYNTQCAQYSIGYLFSLLSWKWQLLDRFWIFFFLAVPVACGSSQARNGTYATAVTQATAETTLNL